MKKKLLALTLALTLCFGSTMTVNAAIPMLPGSGSGSGALSSLNNDKLTIKDLGQTNTNDSKSYKSNYTKLEINVIKSLFDPEYYAKQNPDVVSALGNNKEALWNHYVSHGLAEGRPINKNFNVLAYSAAYPDLQKAFGDDILAYYVHYMNYGKNENRQITTLEKAASAGITVKGMNGQVVANPAPVVPKVNLVNNSNSNNNESLASAVQGTMNINNGSGSGSSDSGDKKPEETVCQHEYEVTKIVIEAGYHIINKKCAKCGDVVEGTSEDHNYDTIKECGNGQHSRVCAACGAVDVSSLANHEFSSVPYDETHHRDTCDVCGYYTESEHTYQDGKCSVCGYICREHQWSDGKCTVCNYECPHGSKTLVSAEPISLSKHKATYSCQTCGKELATVENCSGIRTESIDGTYHGEKCTVCGNAVNKQAHNFCNWGIKDDNHHTKSCSMCGYSVDEPHYSNEGVRSLDSTQHGKVCDVCGSYFEKAKHTFGEDGKCTVCGEECAHEFEKTATLINDDAVNHSVSLTCKICGYTETGAAESHTFGDWEHTNLYEHKKECSDCGWIIVEPCTEDQTPQNNHGYNHYYTCLVCGNERYESHRFDEGGYCICGQPKGDGGSEYGDDGYNIE